MPIATGYGVSVLGGACVGAQRAGRFGCRRAAQPRSGFRGRRHVVTPLAIEEEDEGKVDYGDSWYEQTKKMGGVQTKQADINRKMAEYREANRVANNGREREDLYTENWDGDVYKKDGLNILQVLILIFFLVPALGLVFAFKSYGVLWG